MSFSLLVLAALVLTWSPAQAAFSNYNSILIGEQSAGLGGAYTAMSGDAAGAPFYNPAGLAWMTGNSFSSSVSIYKKFDTQMGKEEDITKAALRVNQGFFQSIPSSSGSVIRWGDYNFGLSVVVPDYETFNGEINTSATNTATFSFLDESLWVGPTLAKRISATETAGLTIYYTARNFSQTVQDRTVDTTSNTAELFTEEKNLKGNSVVMVLGYQWQPTESLRLGLSYRSPGIEVSGSGSFYTTKTKAADGKLNIDTNSRPSIVSNTRIPGRAAIGLSYRRNKWLMTMDGSFHFAEDYREFEPEGIGARIVHRPITNGALGFQWDALPGMIVRFGGFTNLSSHKELNLSHLTGSRVDQLGVAANVTLISKDKIRFTFGGYYTGGTGKSIQRVNQSYIEIPKTQQVFTMLLGTSYYF